MHLKNFTPRIARQAGCLALALVFVLAGCQPPPNPDPKPTDAGFKMYRTEDAEAAEEEAAVRPRPVTYLSRV